MTRVRSALTDRWMERQDPMDGVNPSRRAHGEDDRIADAIDPTAIREAVANLSERDRWVLFEYFIEGHSQSQIAADHGMSQMQVSRRITASFRRLRDLLE